VLIDEVQRLPSLLNTLQALLDREPRRWKFLLCGSSARKLRRGGANLLPGRVHTYRLGPIVSGELDYRMATREALSTGTLPGVLVDPDPAARRKTLRSYAATYLKEEVQAESLSRNLEGFARYLSVVAAWSGQFLDHAKLAAAAQVSRPSAVRWFEVLEDTLIVLRAEAFAKSLTRRLVQHPKLYFFDVGVLNGLLPNFEVSADRIGLLFEHLVFGQLVHGAAARDVDVRLSTFRTEHGAEVDFVVELERTVWAIELKASRRVDRTDLRGLRRFADYYGRRHRPVVLYLGDERRRIESVDVLPWKEGLREMGL
jgi:predicted AAA+ superfamily ATPase